MATLCGWASIDERGKATGGKPGDQTKKEVRVGNWYNFGQTAVLRFKDRSKAAKAAQIMRLICANDCVGYCQGHRTTLFTELQKVNWNVSKLTTNCETDCSALIAVVLNAVGIKVSKDIYTGNMIQAIMATGEFTKLSGSKYVDRGDYNMRGDISVRAGKHTIMAIEDGEQVKGSTQDSTTQVVNGQWKGKVTASVLNIRKQPGAQAAKLVSYPQLTKGTEVTVCKSVKAPDGSTWYYIGIDGANGRKYGYAHSAYIKAM